MPPTDETPKPKAEPYLSPGELTDALNAAQVRGPCGRPWTPRACRKLLRALRAAGVPSVCRKYVRASDAAAFLRARPGWRPFSKNAPCPPNQLPTR